MADTPPHGPDNPIDDPVDKLAEQALDALLASGAADLLDHVRANTDPSQILTALLDLPHTPRPQPAPAHPPTPPTGSKQQLLNRIQTWTLARALDLDRDRVRDLDLALDLALDRARDRARDRDLALVLARALARDLALAGALDRVHDFVLADALDRALALVLDRAHDLDLALDRAHDLVRVRVRVRVLARALDRAWAVLDEVLGGMEVNVSGVDLTDVNLTQFDRGEALTGVVWDEATRWPPEVREWIEARSEQIEPGLYRVRDGTERDPRESASV
ncbi:hypothetical protein [Actinomadura terrae]|uniref:hypothetical protein n=1 Tax=Actinomadura terrae TaxID=604353 RepID=UPI001FA723D8|nr:hypothetical protein [Actinomadura terrae]